MKNRLSFRMFLASFIISSITMGCRKTEKVHADTVVILSGSNPEINTCGWIMKVNENTSATSPENSFKPINLDQRFQTDGMQVKITYTIPDAPPVKCGSNSAGLPGYTQIDILSVQQIN